MRKIRTLTIVFLLILATGIPVHAAGFRNIDGTMKKNGSCYMWIDKQQRLHIRKPSEKKDLVCITECDGGVSDGKTVYYWDRDRSGALISKYSIPSRSGKRVVYLQGITKIVGAYKNRLMLEGCRPDELGGWDTLYVYDTKSGKINRIGRAYYENVGIYNEFFVFKGLTGGLNGTTLGVYDAKNNKVKRLTEKCWYIKQDGSKIYYADEVANPSSFVCVKMKIYRYSMTTGEKKAVSKVITVSVTGNNSLSKNRFVYFDESGTKHTLRF